MVLPDDLNFIGQVGLPDSGRPDVVGSDDLGRERLLLEAKFAAELTNQQPKGYLGRLSHEVPTALLVVAPSVRLASLWPEMVETLPSATAPSPSAELPPEPLHLRISETQSLVLVSWRNLVNAILDALRSAGETMLAHDMDQLLALTEVMDAAAYSPIRSGDYGPRAARQIHQLQGLIDDTWAAAKQSDHLERKGNSSHGRIFYGWYLTTCLAKKTLWYGFLPREWDRRGQSPLWTQIEPSAVWTRQRLTKALSGLDKSGGPGLFEGSRSLYVPLRIPHFAGQGEAVASLLGQLEQIATHLAAAAPADAPLVPDSPAGPDDLPDDPLDAPLIQ